jgi:hypothetical protein
MKSPEAQCYLCRQSFEYGLHGNPQTWSGIEYKKSCELCNQAVCFDEKCSVSWNNNSLEEHRKLCNPCFKLLTPEEFEAVKGGDFFKISELQKKHGKFVSDSKDSPPNKTSRRNILFDSGIGEIVSGCVILLALAAAVLYRIFQTF